ncbi:hypothetical protein B4135_0906 [Caldibacillus debilis]|uniref:Uncharacterized protein n=1 Tax=Caldibacillus debilis TaxID=301148 RepID=A0A150M5Z1_9BACI|nr:hypothetical protein B4135_0906 [Caldibacillus debilis]
MILISCIFPKEAFPFRRSFSGRPQAPIVPEPDQSPPWRNEFVFCNDGEEPCVNCGLPRNEIFWCMSFDLC